jgi:hypothetical protein
VKYLARYMSANYLALLDCVCLMRQEVAIALRHPETLHRVSSGFGVISLVAMFLGCSLGVLTTADAVLSQEPAIQHMERIPNTGCCEARYSGIVRGNATVTIH